MQENSINIGEILKDAPRGLKLYSPIFGEVELNCVYDTVGERNTIETFDNRRYLRLFSSNGKFHNCPDGECMLFPSEKHRSWVEWQNVFFKTGDVITNIEWKDTVYIVSDETWFEVTTSNVSVHSILPKDCRYATSEEKENFFKELENNGYRWDETFKKIVEIKCSNYSEHNTNIDNLLKNNTFYYPEQETEVEVTPDGCYKCVLKPTKNEDKHKENCDSSTSEIEDFKQKLLDYKKVIEEIKNRYKHNQIITHCFSKIVKLFIENSFTKEEKIDILNRFNVVKTFEEANNLFCEINNEKRPTIRDLKPFDKVLVRNDKKNKWVVEFFSYYKSDDKAFICGGGSWWHYCIPFNNETANLVGTTNEYSTNNKSK